MAHLAVLGRALDSRPASRCPASHARPHSHSAPWKPPKSAARCDVLLPPPHTPLECKTIAGRRPRRDHRGGAQSPLGWIDGRDSGSPCGRGQSRRRIVPHRPTDGIALGSTQPVDLILAFTGSRRWPRRRGAGRCGAVTGKPLKNDRPGEKTTQLGRHFESRAHTGGRNLRHGARGVDWSEKAAAHIERKRPRAPPSAMRNASVRYQRHGGS